MTITQHNSSERGFGLNQLLMAIFVIGIVFHYAGPSMKDVTSEANENVSNTRDDVTNLFSRRF